MIKILEIGMTKRIGGIQTFMFNFHKNIVGSDAIIDYISIYDDPKTLFFYDEIIALGSNIHVIPNYQKKFRKSYKALYELIKKEKYDVVHVNMNSLSYIVPLIAAKKAGAKLVICHAHNSTGDGILKKMVHNFNKRFLKYADIYFSCSDLAGKWFFNKKILNGKNYYFIPNAVDSSKFVYNIDIRSDVRKELGYSDNDYVIGHIGRFMKQKNHKFIIDLFYRLHSKNSNYKLLLIGMGEDQAKYEAYMESLGIRENVKILSFRKDANRLYQAMDVFILPSLYEGLPVVGVEAQVSGLPCLFASNITKELEFTNNCNYIDLNLDEWVSKIEELKEKFVRENLEEFMKTSKFDVKNSSRYILGIIKNYLDRK